MASQFHRFQVSPAAALFDADEKHGKDWGRMAQWSADMERNRDI